MSSILGFENIFFNNILSVLFQLHTQSFISNCYGKKKKLNNIEQNKSY